MRVNSHSAFYRNLKRDGCVSRKKVLKWRLKVDMSDTTEQSRHKKLCYRRGTVRRVVSVNIVSTVETSWTTNPQQIELIELEGCSWPTCSKQPRVVDCRTGVVNKLDRR